MSLTLSERTTPALGVAAAHTAASNAASERFFAVHAESVARACHAMAARFQRGGRLLAYGEGAQRSDVSHVVVEFVHPVIVGKRALPAVALATPGVLDALGRPEDALMLLCAATPTESDRSLLQRAKTRGMLVLALTGAAPNVDADFHFVVPSDDPFVVQETHETLYHVLWELVHVFLEHRVTS
jgi:D-sedoheptulose 7-phosphate isomerase